MGDGMGWAGGKTEKEEEVREGYFSHHSFPANRVWASVRGVSEWAGEREREDQNRETTRSASSTADLAERRTELNPEVLQLVKSYWTDLAQCTRTHTHSHIHAPRKPAWQNPVTWTQPGPSNTRSPLSKVLTSLDQCGSIMSRLTGREWILRRAWMVCKVLNSIVSSLSQLCCVIYEGKGPGLLCSCLNSGCVCELGCMFPFNCVGKQQDSASAMRHVRVRWLPHHHGNSQCMAWVPPFP